MALDPDLPDAYRVRGMFRFLYKLEWSRAREDLEHALALKPNDSVSMVGYGAILASVGRIPEALARLRTATALDPLSAGAWKSLGFISMAAGDLATARKALERVSTSPLRRSGARRSSRRPLSSRAALTPR